MASIGAPAYQSSDSYDRCSELGTGTEGTSLGGSRHETSQLIGAVQNNGHVVEGSIGLKFVAFERTWGSGLF